MNLLDTVTRNRILPAVGLKDAASAPAVARALLEGGLDIMEITFRHPAAPDCVRAVRENVPEITCGAGTLLSISDLDNAIVAGAQFGVSPGFHPEVVRAAAGRGFPLIPGVLTPGEIEQSLALGCNLVKFFPAEASGGTRFLEAISGPYAHTPLRVVPLGGISPANLASYLALPIVAAVGGSWLTNHDLVASGNYHEISNRVQIALAIATQVHPA